MKKPNSRIIWIFGVAAVIIFVIGFIRVVSGEDDWICQSGQWVKHGFPSSAMPTTPCK